MELKLLHLLPLWIRYAVFLLLYGLYFSAPNMHILDIVWNVGVEESAYWI